MTTQQRLRRIFSPLFLAVIFLAGFSSQALAQGLALRTSPRLMQGIRPLGMGGAFIAVDAADENVLFYNPAAIRNYEKKIHMQFLIPSIDFSYKAIPFFASDLLDLADDIDGADTNTDKINVFDAFAAANTGRYEEVGMRGPVAMLMHPTITAALFYETRAVMGLLNPASSTIDLEAVSHGGLSIGSAYGFFDDKLKAGIALKFLERHLIDEALTQRDMITNDDFTDALDLKQLGFGVGADVGFQVKPKFAGKAWKTLDPTFAFTIQDVGDTRFFQGDDVGRINESTTVGFAFHPKYWKLHSAFAFDIRDIEHQTDLITKLHTGYEVTWPEISKILRSASIRVGAHQGYLAGGFGLDFKYFKMNAVTYGREIGQSTRQKESRMFGLQLASGF